MSSLKINVTAKKAITRGENLHLPTSPLWLGKWGLGRAGELGRDDRGVIRGLKWPFWPRCKIWPYLHGTERDTCITPNAPPPSDLWPDYYHALRALGTARYLAIVSVRSEPNGRDASGAAPLGCVQAPRPWSLASCRKGCKRVCKCKSICVCVFKYICTHM